MTDVTIYPNVCSKGNIPETGEKIIRPWQRAQGPTCYNDISSRDLQMRRKVEILKYQQPGTKMSKKQMYARAANNTLTRRNKSYVVHNLDTQGNSILLKNCDQNQGTPSGNTGVPGPSIKLYLDPKIPLTQYSQQRRQYRAGGEKWPQVSWYPGANGFPVGKKGNLNRNIIPVNQIPTDQELISDLSNQSTSTTPAPATDPPATA
jgi:hypothetical protein